ncbi:hypothetical protein PIB30_102874, partial [Stylosanthes scabra]|nr:hypothetical protein [Stylosanthes scabra]
GFACQSGTVHTSGRFCHSRYGTRLLTINHTRLRPFLATGRTLIDVQKGELTFRVHKEQLVINVFEATQLPEEEDVEECMRIDVINKLAKEINKEEILKSDEEEVQKSLHSTFKNKARKLWDPGSYHSISIGELGLNPYIPP